MFAKEGYSTIGFALVVSIIFVVIGLFAGGIVAWVMYALAVLTTAFILYFFRDPERTLPDGFEDKLIAPADGKVIMVTPGLKHDFFDEPCTQISIFLSPLDVHVNRVPASGSIVHVKYFPGEYLVAWHEKASELNERSEFGMIHPTGGKVFFRQITGYIARRIVFDLKEGDEVTAGDKFGMMKFGSRMDILVPDSMKLIVKPGDRTVAGESVMGIFK